MHKSIQRSCWVGLSLLVLAAASIADESPKTTLQEEFVLTLGEQRFDPLVSTPAPPAVVLGRAPAGGPNLHLVQFNGPIQKAWLREVRGHNLQVVQYIHPYTYVVWGDAADLPAAERANGVRWNGPFQPAFRLLPQHRQLAGVRSMRALLTRAADTSATVDALAALGAKVDGWRVISDKFELVTFDLDGSQLSAVANLAGIYSVRPVPTDGGLRGEMSDQVNANNVDETGAAFPGYESWLSSIGLDGSGVIIANVDGGIQNDHPDLAGRLVECIGSTCGGSTASSHGTHTAGIMAADGSSGVFDSYGFLRGLGVAPGASLVEQLYSPWYTQAGGMQMLIEQSHANGASLSGNSWGPSSFPQGYDDDTMQVDIAARDADPDTPGNQQFTFVLSIMNGYGGTSSQGTPDEAKNIFTVGSTKMQTSSGAPILEINDLSANSAHGPCLDGRRIPHMVAPGCSVDSTITSSSYSRMCGTSMASPHVSGAVALFIEYYRGLPEYTADPSPALIKAAFLPVAHDLAGHLDADGGVLGHVFDSKQGWGRMDLEAVVAPELPVRYFDQTVVFSETGQEWVQELAPADPSRPLRIMLVWTDAPGHGLGGSTPAWNNNLDLVVENETNTYYGNTFDAAGWSAAGGAPDGQNNTEGVFLGPTSGPVTVRVVAANINSDGVPNYGDDTDQDFALVAYNALLESGFSVAVTPATQSICAPQEAAYSVTVEPVLGYAEPITLELLGDLAGMTAVFSPNPVVAPATSTLTISGTQAAPAGSYTFQVEGTSGALARATGIVLNLYASVPAVPVPTAPADGAVGVGLRPAFAWDSPAGAATYDVEVALDSDFTEVVAAATGLPLPSFTPDADLEMGTTYYWHVRAVNACGAGEPSAVQQFTTRSVPPILLVDDDDNAPNVRAYYTDALDALGLAYDVWDTLNSDDEPTLADLSPYAFVIWFTGAEFGGACGPGSAGEFALAAFLDSGRNLFISAQDYYHDRGLTGLMTNYLGVASVTDDVYQTIVTGAGSVMAGRGPYALTFVGFSNWTDRVIPDDSSETAFTGNQGSAGVDKDDGVYRTMFLGFPLEAIPGADARALVLSLVLDWFRPFIDCNENGVADHADIWLGTSLDEDGDGVPDECVTVAPGDMNCDGVLNVFDIDPFVLALTDPAGYAAAFPACDGSAADINEDGQVNAFDIDPFVELLTGP